MAKDMQTNSLENFWIPFTDNKGFKAKPRLITSAKGNYLTNHHGNSVLDGSSGLFCSPAGHCHPKIIEAVHKAMQNLTYVSAFGTSHPAAFALAQKLSRLLPEPINHVFFVNSGSEAIDTALKTVMAYHSAMGEDRHRYVSRERAYHGVNIGGVGLSGLVNNRKTFQDVMPNIVHMRHTWNPDELMVRGQPELNGIDLANDLQRAVDNYGGTTIAACFVEPVAGSTGSLAPPKGYLERLRQICDENGILLVFDEVITGFGRIGGRFAADVFGVTPDIMTMAKALTNGSIPMGAVAVKDSIYAAITDAAAPGAIEFFHGYTYSGHPAACAAGLASLELYEDEGLFQQAEALSPYFLDAIYSLRDHPKVRDIRGIGLMAGLELRSNGKPGARGSEAQKNLFWNGLHAKFTGDTAILAPMFIAEEKHIDEMVEKLDKTLNALN
ncbi:MAG: aminotransferase class III-fold pyridoxal phosphate-dependent enzyme [Rhodobacteraceae bacterium]|nr:aminotransferase class III-fold pyridoxal phosphate-dependent enzyme [Paracoccaceae bacterium]